MDVFALYQQWLEKTKDDQKLYDELLAVKGDEKAIEDRFYKGLAFGTGGLRGVLGAGTNRMNVYSVGKATLGLADYLVKKASGAPVSVAIAFAWILRHPAFKQAVTGTTNPQRMKEICAAADITLTREEWYQLYLATGKILP